jgi:hypothetical protein
MCEMCELALARGEEAPAYHTLPVHPDYLRKPEPKFAATEVDVAAGPQENSVEQHITTSPQPALRVPFSRKREKRLP